MSKYCLKRWEETEKNTATPSRNSAFILARKKLIYKVAEQVGESGNHMGSRNSEKDSFIARRMRKDFHWALK